MDFIKNKPLIIVGVVILLAITIGGYVFLSNSASNNQTATPGNQEENIKQLTPEDIGLSLELSEDQKNVLMKINKLDGIKSIEYEVSYNAESPAGEESDEGGEAMEGGIPRGVVAAPIDITPGESEVEREILLGTCSANKCKYDIVVSDIEFIIRVNFEDGSVGSVQTSVPIK